jgi:hypothetical protein
VAKGQVLKGGEFSYIIWSHGNQGGNLSSHGPALPFPSPPFPRPTRREAAGYTGYDLAAGAARWLYPVTDERPQVTREMTERQERQGGYIR